MRSILDTALPFFVLIFCGYAAGRIKLLPEASAAGLNAFVFYFALPAFLFDLISKTGSGYTKLAHRAVSGGLSLFRTPSPAISPRPISCVPQ